jgi:hypothetical protein
VRAALFAIVVAGCHGAPSAKPPPNDQLRMAFVYGAPGEQGFGRMISIQTYGRAAKKGEHWTVVDPRGFVADAEITEPEPGECDHCPPHRMLARVLEHRAEWGANYVAIGPASGPLRSARIIRSNWQAHSQLDDDKFTFELEIDADGDGIADLARWVRGPHVEYELRARIGGSWVPRERWLTDDILDVTDKCPDPPTDDDDGCPK